MTLYNVIQENIDKLDWFSLSFNNNAIHLLEQNPDKINWKELSINKNESLWRDNSFVLK